jgi:hypothetical protein
MVDYLRKKKELQVQIICSKMQILLSNITAVRLLTEIVHCIILKIYIFCTNRMAGSKKTKSWKEDVSTGPCSPK